MSSTVAGLLAEIEASFEAPDGWLAYADWLQQADAPRGELIVLDLALETADPDRRPVLEARRTELLATRAPILLGDTFSKFIAEGYGTITWRRGFVDSLAYPSRQLAHRRAVAWLVNVICEQYPEPFTFLRELALPGSDLHDVTPLLRFAQLRRLDLSGTGVAELRPLAQLARLTKLDLINADQVTRAELVAFRQARPDVEVVYSKVGR